jgi:sugar transferase (PEP-CTERM system associated)
MPVEPLNRTDFWARLVNQLPKSVWAIVDTGSVCLGNYIGYRLFHIQFPRSTWVADMTLVNLVVALCVVCAGVMCGLYDRETLQHRSRIAMRSTFTLVIAVGMAYAIMHALMYEVYSRRIAVVAPVAFMAISGGFRVIAYHMIKQLRNRILFVGCGPSVSRVLNAMGESDSRTQFSLTGYVAATNDAPKAGPDGLPYLGHVLDIQEICRTHRIEEVVIGVEEGAELELSQTIMACLRLGCRVTNQPMFYERVFGEVPADHITAEWFLFADLDGHREERATLKRISDVCFASLGLILSAPLWGLVALGVRLDSKGPVFYSQKRVGCHNRLFKLTKFRTMGVDAEADGHAWAVPGDPRITRFGRFLRRSHLDELPQLWSILIGDMSLVGPRPERPEFVRELIREIPYYDERHLVRPGLTGWAQANYRYGSSIEDSRRKLFLDLFYIKHMSMELDLVILFRTLGTLLGRGPSHRARPTTDHVGVEPQANI